MPSNCRRSASARAWISMNSLPRWLISITDMPLPCQSSISCAARCRTGSGKTAGPALKLNTRGTRASLLQGPVGAVASRNATVAAVLFAFSGRRVTVTVQCVAGFLGLEDLFDTGERFVLAEVDEPHALGRAAE